MAEILLIPELRDEIAKFGIPNYQFLRCLNKELHNIWEYMFCECGVFGMMNEEEYRDTISSTRILDIDFHPRRKFYLIDAFNTVTYVRMVEKNWICPEFMGLLKKIQKVTGGKF